MVRPVGSTVYTSSALHYVQVYGNTEPYKVTSMVEFIGVLSVDPALAHFEDEGDEDPFQTETAAERKVHSPPPSLIPRLHCIVARCLAHSNPLLPSNLTTPIKSTGMDGNTALIMSSYTPIASFPDSHLGMKYGNETWLVLTADILCLQCIHSCVHWMCVP